MNILAQQFIRILVLTAIIIGLILGLGALGLNNIIHEDIWSIVIFSSLVGVGVAFVNMYFVKKGSQLGLVNVFLATTAFRMMLSIIFITIVFYLGLENAQVWIANFFVIYLFYLVFEIYTIMANLRAISNEGEPQ
ncbi:MAG: hypothetical protein HEP71_31455 [Roseivirga sp.]|nr:hypothetical protein [Roseivirga sp.]